MRISDWSSDVCSSDLSAARAIAEVRDAFGGLDTIFLNAGIAKFAPLADVTEAFFDEQFTINVKNVLFTIQHASPLLADGGSIVINTSVNANMGMAGTLVYAASKAAVGSVVRVDRKSGGKGKSGAGRISHGGSRTI